MLLPFARFNQAGAGAKELNLQFLWSRKKQIVDVQDEYGRIWIGEKGSVRHLVFGEDSEQSAVCMQNPLRLQYEYSRAMLLGALCADEPETALFLGLGSGALVRSCLAALPSLFDAEIIELRPEVLRVAEQYLGFRQDERMTMRIGDALTLLDSAEPADLIFLDLYSEQGPSRAHMTGDFLLDCRAKLSNKGWLVINQWALLDNTPLASSLLHSVFDGHYWELPVIEGNVIVLIPASNGQNLPVERLRRRATEVGQQQGYDLLGLLKQIRLASP